MIMLASSHSTRAATNIDIGRSSFSQKAPPSGPRPDKTNIDLEDFPQRRRAFLRVRQGLLERTAWEAI